MYTKENFELAKQIVDNKALAEKLQGVINQVRRIQRDGEEYSYQRFDLRQQLADVLTGN